MDKDLSKSGYTHFGRLGSIAFFIVLVLVLSVFMRQNETVSFVFEDESFTIEMVSGFSTVVLWDEINSGEVRETLDLGEVIDGTNNGDEQSGVWENDEFGTYTLCADATVEHYIVLYTANGVVVTNYESDEATDSLGEAIIERLE